MDCNELGYREESEKDKMKKYMDSKEKIKEILEETLMEFGEEKREVKRKLCVWICHHGSPCEYLEKVLYKTIVAQDYCI